MILNHETAMSMSVWHAQFVYCLLPSARVMADQSFIVFRVCALPGESCNIIVIVNSHKCMYLSWSGVPLVTCRCLYLKYEEKHIKSKIDSTVRRI